LTPLALALGLGAAAGVDLPLTLLLLGGLPALTGWPVLPAGLAGLGTPWILVPAAVLYLAEVWCERHSLSSLALWHGGQVLGRPLAGLLLADLVAAGSEPGIQAAAMAVGALSASTGHTLAGGWQAMLHLRAVPGRSRAVAAAAEDAGALAYLALATERPATGLVLLVLPWLVAPRQLRAGLVSFRFLMAALVVSAREHLPGGGHRPQPRPRWARKRLQDVPAGGGAGEAPGILAGGMARAPSIRAGWVVAQASHAVFVARARSGPSGRRPAHPARVDGLFLRLPAPAPDGTPAELIVPAGRAREGVRSLEILV
jgi:hypothetical protein